MKLLFIIFPLVLFVQSAFAEAGFKLAETQRGDEYGYLPTAKPGPLALVFTTDIAGSLNGKFTTIGNTLSKAGYVVASIDLPCHGKDTPERIQPLIDKVTGTISGDGLTCWANRVSQSENDIFPPFLARISRVITDMQSKGLIVGQRIVAIGVSRGGYIALRASDDKRITDIVALAPVTDLQRLREFTKLKVNTTVYGLDHNAATLSRKRLFLQIGSNDSRVGTREVLHLADSIVKAANSAPVDMTLIITPVKGHATAEHDRAVAWIEQSSVVTEGRAPPK